MAKLKIGVIFGGKSTEHDVSIVSGTSIIRKLDKNKYEIFPIYISRDKNWYIYEYNNEIYNVGDKINTKNKINNIMEYLKNLDVIFPVLHGSGGEDGTIQGMFEILNIPYVGSKVLGSSICMDKAYTKIIFEKAKINQANYVYIKKNKEKYILVEEDFSEEELDLNEIINKIIKKLEFPMFIKPSNSGSSVGINKANNIDELKNAIKYAELFDNKILIEEGIEGKEIECAILGNEEIEASILGEIIPAEEFYSYDAKYNNKESKTIIPANLDTDTSKEVRKIAKKAYKATDCRGFARVDFFVDKNNKIYINEINTIPGFTEISMYPKLWEASGIDYTELLDKLINYALN